MRFGKTLVIQEMDGVEPILYPLLRGDLMAQGTYSVKPVIHDSKTQQRETNASVHPVIH